MGLPVKEVVELFWSLQDDRTANVIKITIAPLPIPRYLKLLVVVGFIIVGLMIIKSGRELSKAGISLLI